MRCTARAALTPVELGAGRVYQRNPAADGHVCELSWDRSTTGRRAARMLDWPQSGAARPACDAVAPAGALQRCGSNKNRSKDIDRCSESVQTAVNGHVQLL